MKNNPTIFQIAKTLKLSPSTVSRALKNHPDIAPDTKKKVLDLAEKMDYEPNIFAVGLRKNKSKEIGIILPNLSGFFYDSFISAVEEQAKHNGYSLLILLSGEDPEIELQNLKTCKQRRVDGVLICITSRSKNQEYFRKFIGGEVPLIFFDKIPEMEGIDSACVADVASAEIAANVLMKKEKKRILSIFADLNFSITQKRLQAYTRSFESNKKRDLLIIEHAQGTDHAREIVTASFLAKKKPDAIFCMSDEILIGAMKALQILNVKIPTDVSVLAISNGFFPKLYHPEITYIETSGYKLGQLAFKRLLDCLGGNSTPQNLLLDSLLIEGGSL